MPKNSHNKRRFKTAIWAVDGALSKGPVRQICITVPCPAAWDSAARSENEEIGAYEGENTQNDLNR